MSHKSQLIIFGEVLFDNFPNGEQVLGGAPFNVAWHLQAMGDDPCFISRVGEDVSGRKIIDAMQRWGMETSAIQIDSEHQTGCVDVAMINNEPHYNITQNCAYDFIGLSEIKKIVEKPFAKHVFYHGTLAMRNSTTKQAYEKLVSDLSLSVFLDVNLRSPWWEQDNVSIWLRRARWVKLNLEELQQLGSVNGDIQEAMAQFQSQYELELLIVTRGADGAVIRTREGELYEASPPAVDNFVDTVGAGDAFTAVFLHGLISSWPLEKILETAQWFASTVVGIRGAISKDHEFYKMLNFH